MARRDDLSKSEIDAKLNEFEQKLKRTRTLYEQYFIGIEKMPPRTQRKEIVRLLRSLERAHIQATSQRFRLRALVQRFNSYKSYWDRTERQIEQGTYRRHRAKAERNEKRRKKIEERERARDDAIELDELDLEGTDLEAMQRELEEMDARGAFDRLDEETDQPAPDFAAGASSAEQASPAPVDRGEPSANEAPSEDIRQKRLSEIAQKLGIDPSQAADVAPTQPQQAPRQSPHPSEAQNAPQPQEPAQVSGDAGASPADDARRRKLEAMKQRLQKRTGKSAATNSEQKAEQAPTRGANAEQLRKMHEHKERIRQQQREQQHQQRGESGGGREEDHRSKLERLKERRRAARRRAGSDGEEDTQRIYRNLVEAKRRCNQSTDNLSYENVAKSIRKQREHLRETRGARDVDFRVVIKEGKAFLKPQLKD